MKLLSSRQVLGINSRSLDFIRPLNKKKATHFSKDKIKVKFWLATRGIPVPKTIAMIKNTADLDKFKFETLPAKFVLKPALGSGGNGILVLSKTKKGNWRDPNNRIWNQEDLVQHIIDILDGEFATTNLPDITFFEQRLKLDPFFISLSPQGLPDIRVIVYRQVPVMAMVRIPAPGSGGLANLHQGGVMVGIDIATGEMTHVATNLDWGRSRIIPSLPWSGRVVRGLQIPFWHDILLMASKIQPLTNLGYLAIDFAIDAKYGPMVLEVNARGGLGIQVANKSPLRERLNKLQGLKIPNAEKGVSIARDLFTEKKFLRPAEKVSQMSERSIIGTLEIVKIFHADRRRYHQLPAKITPTKKDTILDLDLARILGLADQYDHAGIRKKIKIEIAGKRMTLAAELRDLAGIGKEYRFNLGASNLSDFLIDPTRRNPMAIDILDKKKIAEEEFQKGVMRLHYRQIDAELCAIDSQLKILSYLRPLNLREEREKFFADKTRKYNPQFQYQAPTFNIDKVRKKLNRIETDDTPLGEIFEHKRQELLHKTNLIEQIDRNPLKFTETSIILYGEPDEKLLARARSELAKIPENLNRRYIKKYSSTEVAEKFEKILLKYGLPWQIELRDDLISGVAVGKDTKLFIKSNMRFAKTRIDALIAHEIETHIFIAENSKRQAYRIFQQGTANYLLTQEGLAAFNQQYRGGDRRKVFFWARNVLVVTFAMRNSFVNTYHYVREMGFGKRQAWGITMRLKRGLGDTSQPGALTKDAIYLRGKDLIEKFILEGGDLRQLYIGKIALTDLPLLEKVSGLQKPHYLPQPLFDNEVLKEAISKKNNFH